jgi:hypothetical protein
MHNLRFALMKATYDFFADLDPASVAVHAAGADRPARYGAAARPDGEAEENRRRVRERSSRHSRSNRQSMAHRSHGSKFVS